MKHKMHLLSKNNKFIDTDSLMKKIGFFSIVALLLFSGCAKDMELEQSVFISDAEYAGLPEYSEWGYNTFGAYYDREVFVSNDIEIPIKIIVNDGITTFAFKGQKGSSGYYNTNEMSVKFILPGFSPDTYADLIVLNDSIIDIQQSGCIIEMYINSTLVDATILNGTLYFKRAQKLLVDTQQVEVILSGNFDFQVIIDDEPISISNGRFDLGIGSSNFFNY